MRVGCVEYAFSLDSGFEPVREAWAMLLEVVKEFEARGEYPLNMVVNLRFIAGSRSFLSPAGGNQRTCYAEALGDIEVPSWRPLAEAFTRKWMTLPNARPHCGKEWDIIPEIGEHIREVYADDLNRFLQIRTTMGVDPDSLFAHQLMQDTLWETERLSPKIAS